jgi:hypothetical protein
MVWYLVAVLMVTCADAWSSVRLITSEMREVEGRMAGYVVLG